MEGEKTQTQSGRSAWSFLLIGLIGAAAGATIGVLFAPNAGEESRRKLANWLKEKREKGTREILARKEQVEAAIAAGRKAYKGEKETIGA